MSDHEGLYEATITPDELETILSDYRGWLNNIVKEERLIKEKVSQVLRERCRQLVDRIQSTSSDKFMSHRTKNGDSLLHLAASINTGEDSVRILDALAKNSPILIAVRKNESESSGKSNSTSKGNTDKSKSTDEGKTKKNGRYRQETALHILIARKNSEGVEVLLKIAKEKNLLENLWNCNKTNVETKPLLHVAATSLDVGLLRQLLSFGAPLDSTNTVGETIIHTLVRLAYDNPPEKPQVIKMLNAIRDISAADSLKLLADSSRITPTLDKISESKLLWHVQNNDGMTALKLAAYLALGDVCAFLLNLEEIYCFREFDGMYETFQYDITELDSVTNEKWLSEQSEQEDSRKRSDAEITNNDSMYDAVFRGLSFLKKKITYGDPFKKSVLEVIFAASSKEAHSLIATEIVREVVVQRWEQLKHIHTTWLLLHLSFMVGLSLYAIYRDSTPLTEVQKYFVLIWSFLNVAEALFYLIHEAIRTFVMKRGWFIRCNGAFQGYLVCFSLSLLVDAIWNWENPEYVSGKNFFIVVALLFGIFFLAFFIRHRRKFAFFMLLFQKLILGELFRFSFMIFLLLVAFTITVYVTYIPKDLDRPEEFKDFSKAFLTMFRLMLGLSDLEILYEAPTPWVTISLYVTFVLLTYVLLLNALIAMMSKTCDLVVQSRNEQWIVQWLSAILMLETFYPLTFRPILDCEKHSIEKDGRHTKYKSRGDEHGQRDLEERPISRTQHNDHTDHYFLRLPKRELSIHKVQSHTSSIFSSGKSSRKLSYVTRNIKSSLTFSIFSNVGTKNKVDCAKPEVESMKPEEMKEATNRTMNEYLLSRTIAGQRMVYQMKVPFGTNQHMPIGLVQELAHVYPIYVEQLSNENNPTNVL